ncbi:Hpt domain-containing protein [Geobacter sp. FeAm09]|uniref:Hpt domain-containing protein n=1 Tax=Geobacter sp. FeAm09 TaxID=2597769 RepID=UPI0011EBBB38|nr:Hpt domain-containing protein [Geobacter sp. FeAm09]QEM67988.1 Hpt domain-containing protein [Geobacter sp. FeAm09]
MFTGQAPHLIGHLADLIEAGDTETTKSYIRKLMVSATTIGAKRLAHLCSHIQSSLDSGNLDDCAQWAAQLPHELELLTNNILLLDRDGL